MIIFSVKSLTFEENTANNPPYSFGWEWYDVGIQPQRLVHLVQKGILKITYKSNKSTNYMLINGEAVREAIEYIIKKETRLSEEKHEVTKIPSDLFSPIIGYEDLKEAFRFVIENPDPKLSILMIGPPASSKSVFLYEIERIAGATYITGRSITGAGIEDEIIEHAEKGIDLRYILIDEFDGLRAQDYLAIREIQWHGRLKTTKSGKKYDIPINAPIFAVANSTRRIPQANLSRFWKGGFQIRVS